MNLSLIIVLTFWTCLKSKAQSQAEILQQNTQNFYGKQNQGMYVLGSWAVANIAGGLALRSTTTGTERYFHEMNAGWNSINLILAAGGLLAKRKEFADYQTLSNKMIATEKTFLFNAALDIAYMTAGLWMLDASAYRQNDQDRLRGYGQSLLLQGGFLFVFDLIMHQQTAKQRKDLNTKNTLSVMPLGTGLSISLSLN